MRLSRLHRVRPQPGVALPDEKFSLDAYMTGMRMGACLWPELAAAA